MATGGLGGVHREAAASFDVSTDLDELARADGMLVVCSGVKSILDVPATLEALETRGVPVVGYGTGEFPAFTTRSSGLPLEARVDSPGRGRRGRRRAPALGLPGAIVLAQPVPEDVALDRAAMEAALAEALARGPRAWASPARRSPRSCSTASAARPAAGACAANIALIVANAGLAGAVAEALGTSRE